MINTKVKRAAIYARISKADPGVDKVENQINELRKLAEQYHYEVVGEFTDDDITAYKGASHRPGYVAMINGLKDKKFDVVMATEPQRFTRSSPTELEILLVECIKAKAVVHTRSAGIQDPKDSTAVALMQIMDVVGGLEVASKIERQKARNRADLAKGLPTKGLRPFGWEKDRITIRKAEAKIIQDAYSAILERGEGISQTARRWNKAGIATDAMKRPRKSRVYGDVRLPSGTWTPTTVKQILLRARNAGILLSDGVEMPLSQIQPIVSRDDFEAMQIALKSESAPSGPKPRYLLGGLIQCTCGQRMHATTSHSKRAGGPLHRYKFYVCGQRLGNDKSHVSISVRIADEVVRDWVVENIGMDLDEFPSLNRLQLDRVNEAIIRLREEESRATDLLIKDLGDRAQLLGRLTQIKQEKSELESSKAELLSSAALNSALLSFQEKMLKLPKHVSDREVDEILAEGYAAWDALPFEDKRAILKGGYEIQVGSGGRGHERVTVTSKNPKSTSKRKKAKAKAVK